MAQAFRNRMPTKRAVQNAKLAATPDLVADATATLQGPGEAVFRSVLDALPVGVLIFQAGPGGMPVCLSANATFEAWARYGRNQLIGLGLPRIRMLADNPRIAVAAQDLLQNPAASAREIDWSVNDPPQQRHLSAHISRMHEDTTGVTRVLVAVRDRTPEIQAERTLRQSMLSDPLTGLPNRTHFTEQLEVALESSDSDVGVAVLNIDRFQRVNESLGHVCGDELLVAIACRLMPAVRSDDCLARLSGDEFAILLRKIDDEDGMQIVADRLRHAFDKPFQISGGDYHVSASVGIATTFSSRRYAEDLLRDADFALHRAKHHGRGGFELYRACAHSEACDQFQLERDLRLAIEADQLQLVFQPIVRLGDRSLAGFEALTRWTHPLRGTVSPSDFIPIAEDSGLIVPLGRWAMMEACRQLSAWRMSFGVDDDISVSVNVSGIQLAQDDVVGMIGGALASTGLPGSCLRVELTESAVIENPERAIDVFSKLKSLNIKIAMDDFGTGYSSLSYLQTLPIDVLKIDRSFVMHLHESEDSRKIVNAIMSLASSFGMRTVAEGIERDEHAESLLRLGCDLGQGYLFARPLDTDEAARLLRTRSA